MNAPSLSCRFVIADPVSVCCFLEHREFEGRRHQDGREQFCNLDRAGRMIPCHCEPPGRANARPMTGSAKQSTLRQTERWIASSQVLLAMTNGGSVGIHRR